MSLKHTKGLSLTELLIGLLVGTFVVAGGVKIFSNNVKSSSDNSHVNALNQDLRTMLELMLHDIRRAGYATSQPDDNVDTKIDDLLKNNPFSEIQIDNANTCIVYTYNKNANTTVDNNERFGFKLITDNTFNPPKKVLKVRRSATALACNVGSWENMTAPDVEITDLTFTLSETPLNVSKALSNPLDPPELACNSGDKCQYLRTVNLIIKGRSTDNPPANQMLTGSVKIRNDRYLASAP